MVTRRAGKMARPAKINNEVIDKLRQAYLIGATNAEACGYADIGERTLYDYLEKNPEFSQKIENWKNEPILKAKTTIVKGLNDIKNAQWYLERKRKAEFAVRQEMTGADGKDLPAPILGGNSVQRDDSNETNTESKQED